MEIAINKEYPYEFILYLIGFFRKMLLGMLDINKVKKIETSLNYLYNIKTNQALDVNLLDLLFHCDKYLKIEEFETKYKLGFDCKFIYPNTNIKIVDIFKFVNYGNTNSTAYSIFTKTFLYIEKNLETIYNMYSFTGGVF